MAKRKNRCKNDFLYPFQESFVESILKDDFEKGKIILPTGSGKGVIGREVFFRIISNYENKFNQFLGIVFTPRLMLNKQWISDFVKYFENQTNPVNFIFVGSENMSRNMTDQIEEALYRINGAGGDKPISTLDFRLIKKTAENNKRIGVNTIVISTYHSNGVVRKSGLEFDLCIFDEAHYLPGREDPRGIQRAKDDLFSATEIIAKKKIFMTATEKLGNVDDKETYKGRGMNNSDIYGDELFGQKDENGFGRRMSPRDLIEFGVILEPLVHFVSTDVKLTTYDIDRDILNANRVDINSPIREREFDEKTKVIFQSFEEHEKKIKEESFCPDKIGAKMLVVSNGSAEMQGIRDSKEMKKMRKKYPDIKLYYISSFTGVDMPEEENIKVSNKSKGRMLDSIKGLESSDRAIIFHIDIMTCGLDIPALTGVLFFRYCKKIKLLQNLGRACRLHDDDRKKWEKGKLKYGDKGYIKPNFYVILPMLFEDMHDFINQFSRTVNEIRNYYDFKAYEFVHIGSGQPTNVVIEDENGIRTFSGNIISEIERLYYHDIESEKTMKEEKRQDKEDEYVKEMYKRGDLEEIKLYIDSLSL
ncbi:MAG: DEAD/DEAH box helicase family protein [Candidatus Asgardarchaeia archaeon]